MDIQAKLYEKIKSEVFPLGLDFTNAMVQGQIENYDKSLGLDEDIVNSLKSDLITYNRFLKNELNQKPVKLRYYQILALYFTEWYFRNQGELDEFNKKMIAYWMATGSGKTIVMHLNMIQYLRRLTHFGKLEVIVTTPLVNLIDQHLRELEPFVRYLNRKYNNKIEASIETTQTLLSLVNKSEDYFTIPNNSKIQRLILVDEAHIGIASVEGAFQRLRKQLNNQNSFIFEYSATFSNLNTENQDEYEKSIVFDYAYKYFYQDGYGKDFYFKEIGTNVIADENKKIKENLDENLQYIQEKIAIWKNLDDYSLQGQLRLEGIKNYKRFPAKPLIAFMGRTVEDPKKEGADDEVADIKKIVAYFGKLTDEERNKYKDVFNGTAGPLTLTRNKAVADEILLSYGDNDYFGIINVGNGDKFVNDDFFKKNNIQIRSSHIIDDRYLFKNIDLPKSPINILIGSRKFAEGWNCFRLSVIGLINLGSEKGNKIIQIFGRGVRLHGISDDGKRRYADNYCKDESDYKRLSDLAKLETLVILSLKRSYLKTFTNVVRNEVPIIRNYEIPVNPSVIKLGGGEEIKFEKYKKQLPIFKLSKKSILVKQVFIVESKSGRTIKYLYYDDGDIKTGNIIKFDLKCDWRTNKKKEGERIINEIRSFNKNCKEFVNFKYFQKKLEGLEESANLYIRKIDKNDNIKEIALLDILVFFKEILFDKQLNCSNIEELNKINVLLLEEFVKKVKNKINYQINTNNYVYDEELKQSKGDKKGDFIEKYIFTKKFKKGTRVMGEVEKEIKDYEDNKLGIEKDEILLKNLDRHIYEPLTDEALGEDTGISPVGLNTGEKKFIYDINNYINDKFANTKDYEFYLMRNVESLKSIGLYLENDQHAFYPDFILWIIDKKKNKVKINFIDPKGQTGIYDYESMGIDSRMKKYEEFKKHHSKSFDIFIEEENLKQIEESSSVLNDKVRIGFDPNYFKPMINSIEEEKKIKVDIKSFILLRDSSPWGHHGKNVEYIQKDMIIKNVLRLDWHEKDEKGRNTDSSLWPDGKTYLDIIFKQNGINNV